MKIYLILLALLFTNTVNAQTKSKPKPVSKSAPKPVPPPQKPIKVKVDNSKSDKRNEEVNYPSVSISSEEQNYRNSAVCTSCDTLILKTGKKHLVVYEIKSMEKANDYYKYSEQPKINSAEDNNSYYSFSDLSRRELKSLRNNFSETEYEFHTINRNTIIVLENESKERFDFLNRLKRHQGTIFWDGNTGSKSIYNPKLFLSSEKFSNGKLVSDYTIKEKEIQAEIQKLKITENVKSLNELDYWQVIYYLEDEQIKLLPFQFFKTKGLKEMKICNSSKQDTFHFAFDKEGRLSNYSFSDYRTNNQLVFNNGLLSKILIFENNNAQRKSLIDSVMVYYKEDTMTIVKKYQTIVFKKIGNNYYTVKSYQEWGPKEEMNTKQTIYRIEKDEEKGVCVGYENEKYLLCSTDWLSLPIKFTQTSRTDYAIIEKINNDLIETKISGKDNLVISFQLKDNYLNHMTLLLDNGTKIDWEIIKKMY